MFHSTSKACERRSVQQGVAAMEFALLLTLMLLILSGAFVFWSLLQAQQTVTRATGDGARVLQQLVQSVAGGSSGPQNIVKQQEIQQQVTAAVQRGLQGAGLGAAAQVQIQWGSSQVGLQVVYPYELLSNLHTFIAFPKSLSASAVVMVPAS